ncbi:MAG: CPBP family intramembrane metalloprotease, partial [Bacteroidales bacterium]|nr:CPBP family intramembrane metalloprotease [Bacteroidales bacterium]
NYFVFSEEENHLYAALIGTLGIAGVTVYYELRYWKSLVVQFCRGGLFRLEVGASLLLLSGLLVLNYLYHFVLLKPYLEENLFADANAWLLFIVFCLLPGITEEIAFRGLVQHWLHVVLTPWRAIALASALFTALHMSIVSAPYLFLVGLLLGWLKWRTNSLYPSMLIHCLHNAIVVFMFPLIVS